MSLGIAFDYIVFLLDNYIQCHNHHFLNWTYDVSAYMISLFLSGDAGAAGTSGERGPQGPPGQPGIPGYPGRR